MLRDYRGLDGHPWYEREKQPLPLIEGLTAPEDFALVDKYYQHLSLVEPHKDLLYVQKEPHPLSKALPDGFGFLGFELVSYEDEWGVFSSLYHEVIWGSEPSMSRFAEQPNTHLLCRSLAHAAEIQAKRNELLAENPRRPTLETACTPSVMAIYGKLRGSALG